MRLDFKLSKFLFIQYTLSPSCEGTSNTLNLS